MPTKNKIKPSDISKMLKLKNKGWSFQRIAEKYKLHHSAISYWFKKLKLKYKKNKVGIKKKVIDKKKIRKYKNKNYKKLVAEPKKTYADYLRIDRERKKSCSHNRI